MVSFEMNDRKKIGLGLTGFGIFFSFLGVMFFFDKGLLAMGNILFVSGVSLTIGLKSTMQFFMKRSNFKVNFVICFFLHSMSLHGSFSTLTFYIFTGSVGNHFIWYWIHYSYIGVAYSGHDCGVLWIHRTLQQWFLAYTGCFHSEDPCSRLVVSTTIHSIVIGSIQRQTCARVARGTLEDYVAASKRICKSL
ncbi:hypothetical protein VIGAN_05258500 [Vigna angularis var. angularis]|uniref:Vesicle transport protein n=1 Tax=Vigna angularis var. angularis TaxID=157739 RepID=A0A0S3S817_PHAAN|nr:hypothetical protein VIGAN_05258500 [Vigna angularis var. angularis]